MVTCEARAGAGQSTWFCYIIPLQLLLNWLQFLRHSPALAVSTDNYPGYVHKLVLQTTAGGNVAS